MKEHTIKFSKLSENTDFKAVVKWKRFDNNKDEHLRLLKGLDDPLTLDNFLEEIENDPSIEIVQLVSLYVYVSFVYAYLFFQYLAMCNIQVKMQLLQD